MKIKNLQSGNILTVDYFTWKKDYLTTEKYKNFEITDYSDIIELYKYDNIGNPIFSQVIDRKFGISVVKSNPDLLFYKELGFKYYDKYLLNIKSKNYLFLNRYNKAIIHKKNDAQNAPKKNAALLSLDTWAKICTIITFVIYIIYLIPDDTPYIGFEWWKHYFGLQM